MENNGSVGEKNGHALTEEFLPLSDLASYADTTPDYLRYLIFKKKLQGQKIGKIWFSKRIWVDEMKGKNGSVFEPQPQAAIMASSPF